MAKREVKAPGGAAVKSVAPLKSEERRLGESMESMISIMSRIYRNQVLRDLNQGTIRKFADAKQTGNYAKILTKLSKRVRTKMMKRFDDKRIRKMIEEVYEKSDKRSRDQLYGRLSKAIGIPSQELLATEGLQYDKNALVIETLQWATKLRDETLELYTANTLRAMTHGESLEQIMDQFKGLEEKRRGHAKFTARNQINNFNSVTTKLRAQNIGIKKAKWKTAGDEAVRRCHAARHNKEFDLATGLYSSCDGKTLLPGVDYNCRCTYELIIPEI